MQGTCGLEAGTEEPIVVPFCLQGQQLEACWAQLEDCHWQRLGQLWEAWLVGYCSQNGFVSYLSYIETTTLCTLFPAPSHMWIPLHLEKLINSGPWVWQVCAQDALTCTPTLLPPLQLPRVIVSNHACSLCHCPLQYPSVAVGGMTPKPLFTVFLALRLCHRQHCAQRIRAWGGPQQRYGGVSNYHMGYLGGVGDAGLGAHFIMQMSHL